MSPADGVIMAVLVIVLLYGAAMLAIGIVAMTWGADADARYIEEWERFERAFFSWLAAALDVVSWLIGRRREPAQKTGSSRPSQSTSYAGTPSYEDTMRP
jgi:hypothetical protein